MRKTTASFFMAAITVLTAAALLAWPVERWETVRTAKVVKGSVEKTISVTGTAARKGEYYSSHAQGGVVVQVYVKEGQAVSQGQPLYRLDDAPYQKSLKLAMQSLQKAEQAQAALNKKAAEAFGSQGESLAVQSLSAYDGAQAELNEKVQALTDQIEGLTLRASKDGQVLELLAREGELLLPGSPGAVLSAQEPEVRVQVTAKDVQAIQEGMKARLSRNSIPLGTAVVEKVGVLKPNSQGVPYAQVVLSPVDGLSVPVGTQVEVDIILAERTDVPVVPVEALSKNSSLFQVYEGRAWETNAQVALNDGTWAAVNSLPVGAEVVLEPQDDLKDGARLKVVKP